MPTLKQIYFASVLVCALLTMAAAQESNTAQKSTLTITANATGDRVRITAPSSVVQLHVEVYAAGGEKLFDQEIRGGNVFDWHLQDGQAQRLAPGTYVCVVTAKTVSGKLTQKIGTVTVAEKSATVQPADASQLSSPQAQVIGPVEENSSWTVASTDAPLTPTMIANDGTDGQMIRGRGALTFRIGNFFSGTDQEQMRLTETGNLGIGTSTPQSKLDVAGTIRAEHFLLVKPNKSGSDKNAAGTLAADGADSVQPLVSGTGTAGRLTKWTDGSGTLADSVITEASNNIGISNTSPVNKLDIIDTNVTPGSAAINISGTAATASTKYGLYSELSGGSTTNIAAFFDARGANNNYGLIVNRGNVGIGTTGPIAKLQVAAGSIRVDNNQQLEFGGGVDAISGANSNHSLTFWTNNIARLQVNNAGNVGIGISNPSGPLHINAPIFAPPIGLPAVENGLLLGTNGTASYKWIQSYGGPLSVNPRGNNVGIGTTTPAAQLDVAGTVNTSTQYNIRGHAVLSLDDPNTVIVGNGFSTLITGDATLDGTNVNVPFNLKVGRLFLQTGFATSSGSVCYSNLPDGYSVIAPCVSSRRYKTNIARLGSGLDLVLRLRPITFDWKEGGKHDLGLIAEDVTAIEPLLATYDSKGQVEGVKYDRIGVVLIKAVQEQQAQITHQQELLERQEEQISRYQKLARQQQAMLTAQQQQVAGLKKIVCRSRHRCV